MPLWTPWKDEPLDLRKVKETSTSQELYHAYSYPRWRYAAPQSSPDSVSSVSSGYCGIKAAQLVMPILSPPESPESSKRYREAVHDPAYEDYERQVLQAMAHKNGGSLIASNPQMRRCVQTGKLEDDKYRQQRNKNNLAAKQSRDRRKLREAKLAIRVQYLEGQLAQLQAAAAAVCCSRCGQPSIN